MAYLTLLLSALVAATLLPMLSEALLAYHLTDPFLSIGLLLGVATLVNVLGSTVNWARGRFLRRFQGRRWFPVSPAALARAEARNHRCGLWSLLASWMPVIGDPLTVVAGIMREPRAGCVKVSATTHIMTLNVPEARLREIERAVGTTGYGFDRIESDSDGEKGAAHQDPAYRRAL